MIDLLPGYGGALHNHPNEILRRRKAGTFL
jgi:hypothetical protein